MNNVLFPSEFYQSDSIKCSDYYSEYLPSDGWILSYYLINSSNKLVVENGINVIANTETNKYDIELTSTETSVFLEGYYSFNAVFTNSLLDSKVTKNLKSINIKQNIETSDNFDNRSWAVIALENVKAVLQSKATMQQKSYEISDRKLEKIPLKELREIYEWLKSEVAKEQVDVNGKRKGGGKIYIRFTNK